MTTRNPRSKSRTQQRYTRKKAKERSARPVEATGNGQGGFMGGFSAGGMM
jgi:predicted lipid-binding transport protein (Tim44 family)